MAISVVVLAAGQGKRMRSSLPKVLHPLAGKPLLAYVLDAANSLSPAQTIVIYGHGGDVVKSHFSQRYANLTWTEQKELLGTGHAVLQALPQIPTEHQVLMMVGDMPLIKPQTLRRLVEMVGSHELGVITAEHPEPERYGRIQRSASGEFEAIVEYKDANAALRAVKEINSGIILAPCALLQEWLPALESNNAQGEYYLTDITARAVNAGIAVKTLQADYTEIEAVNSQAELAQLERFYQRQRAEELLAAGVMLADPARIDVRGRLEVGHDVRIDVNVVFEGDVSLADGVTIEANCILRNAHLAAGAKVKANSILEDAKVGEAAVIGPFARLRPGAVVAADARIGNFVEVKKSYIGPGSKVNHLSYIGDAMLGSKVNVGAGTITCNYDGVNKHQTEIADGAFIGSNSSLVAPLKVGAHATIGAGSTVTKHAPAAALTVSRSKQVTLSGWQRPSKNDKER